ncbi:MAG: hypothetical protein B7Y45_02270 [Sphingomonas sp. 28-66-16]|nr:MAG: hypothetical protein B7Y45_02270 [Sphingomonas sp. 28-66-16]
MSHDAPAIAPGLRDTIPGTHRRALEKVFQHPLTHNLTLREVTHLFETIGSAEHQHNGDVLLRVGGEHLSLKPTRGKDLDATEVMDLRHLLVRGGWSDNKPAQAIHAEPEPIPES